MAISNNGQQYQNVNNNRGGFINLQALAGSGESTMFVDEVVGVLLGIETREGFYTIKDRRTGQPVQRPNSWIAHWMTDKGEKLMSWPTYVDPNDGLVKPWSRFDQSINLAACSAQKVTLHMWKDDRSFYHLEVMEEQVNLNLMPIQQPTAVPAVAAWEMAR